MRRWAQYGVAALAGAALCFAATSRHVHVVHAQTMYTPGCITSAPKSWGVFRGVSDEGLAFEDAEGTIRVIAHPLCGNGLEPGPTPRPDLEIRRP